MATSIQQFIDELEKSRDSLQTAGRLVAEQFPDRRLFAHQAEWHGKGVIHHTHSVIEKYADFAHGVVMRASIEPKPNAIFMPASLYQEMMFEFYAGLNLARITLDNLRVFLRPLFATDFGQIPKSITDILQNKTDCPIYDTLLQSDDCSYLIDLRNCLVHHRTFATADQAIVIEDGHESEVNDLTRNFDWLDSFARAYFRRENEKIVVNIYLPDMIFRRDGNDKKLATFTYDRKINLLSQTMHFARLTVQSVTEVCRLLSQHKGEVYTYSRSKQQR
ncbi:hypothetical protein Poly51_30920 [Rubripirellula tenax]|uniref:Cthe-2314-like HEPN domain-containing protein n=1 Tax=Rubripirellula tenax TaxID=2528015 RepID=A0A5C6EZZ0_9BACT|nr:hypothetical protein [Rubripirellula tenax]TWU54375.1 hypothetical protein Poly51_30920 [Rubripirellula tenax]